MKKIIYSLLLSLIMILPSCVQRTIIPDEELAKIFRDAFLANAYVYDAKVQSDTVQVYQPIFDKYGYTAEDVSYTVGSFSKRKSARLSDVVEQAIKLLEEGESLYSQETMILDSIDAKALRSAKRRFYYDKSVTYYSLRDSVDLKIKLDSLMPGEYKLHFTYNIDSLDNNRSNYRSMSWVELSDENKTRRGLSTSYLRKSGDRNFEKRITFDTLTSKFVIKLAESFEVKRTPHITFTDVTVDYTPPLDIALEEYYERKMNIRIFADDFFKLQPTDSL